jgi:two-component system nitrate/nitrite sensor histidine kinase NarX
MPRGAPGACPAHGQSPIFLSSISLLAFSDIVQFCATAESNRCSFPDMIDLRLTESRPPPTDKVGLSEPDRVLDESDKRAASTPRAPRQRLFTWLTGLAMLLVALMVAQIGSLFTASAEHTGLSILTLLLAATGIGMVAVISRIAAKDFFQPLSDMRRWAKEICNGRLSARISNLTRGTFKELADDLNRISDAYQALAVDMESQVLKQMEHVRHKARSLEILYDVAASINSSRDLDDLLTRFLHTLKQIVHARAATVRLLTQDDQMRLVASTGLSDEVVQREQLISAQRCMCGQAMIDGKVHTVSEMQGCGQVIGTDFFADEDTEMIAVPLQYRGRTLGVYNLFISAEQAAEWDEDRDLLISIGRHLGMAIEKAEVDEEANRLSIMEERTRIAHELHDSLAQTLASLRFQVRVLDETLHLGDESALWQELEGIENSLDEAYMELRGLIDHFRAPIDRRGLVPAIEKLVDRFRRESDIQIFLQKEWDAPSLSDDKEIEVIRIVQEALANVRKHSQAHAVRVLLRGSERTGTYGALIEDDGTGLSGDRPSGAPGEHVGLSIMEERARRLGGEIRIESEPGEGTRVQLSFRTPPESPMIEIARHSQISP